MKKLMFVFIVLICVTASVFAAGKKEVKEDNSLEYVLSKGTFVLGLDDSFPPMGYRDENNEIVGFDIDVAREVCKRMGVELVLQPINWDAKELELNSKQIDCIWNGFTVTEERKKQMTFSDSYVKNAQVVIVLEDSPYKKLSDLKGKTVGLQAGSSASDAIEDTPSFKEIVKKIVEFKDNLTAIMDLEVGGCDAVVMDLLVANYEVMNSSKKMRILSETLASEEYAVGFRFQDKALADEITRQMKSMAKDGSLSGISTKWFGADITVIGK